MLLVVAVAGYGYMPHFGSPLTTAPHDYGRRGKESKWQFCASYPVSIIC